MNITNSPKKLSGNYGQSASGFIAYLEKENMNKPTAEHQLFFSHTAENISEKQVMTAIDANTANLKKSEPKIYSLTINSSKNELRHLLHHSGQLKQYTRKLWRIM